MARAKKSAKKPARKSVKKVVVKTIPVIVGGKTHRLQIKALERKIKAAKAGRKPAKRRASR